jgi:hypothetical protein
MVITLKILLLLAVCSWKINNIKALLGADKKTCFLLPLVVEYPAFQNQDAELQLTEQL